MSFLLEKKSFLALIVILGLLFVGFPGVEIALAGSPTQVGSLSTTVTVNLATDVVLATPTGVQAGDLLIAMMFVDATGSVDWDAGTSGVDDFTKSSNIGDLNLNAGDSIVLQAWYRHADGTEAASYTWSPVGTRLRGGWMLAFRPASRDSFSSGDANVFATNNTTADPQGTGTTGLPSTGDVLYVLGFGGRGADLDMTAPSWTGGATIPTGHPDRSTVGTSSHQSSGWYSVSNGSAGTESFDYDVNLFSGSAALIAGWEISRSGGGGGPGVKNNPRVDIGGFAYPGANIDAEIGGDTYQTTAWSSGKFSLGFSSLDIGNTTFAITAKDLLGRLSMTSEITSFLKYNQQLYVANVLLSPTIEFDEEGGRIHGSAYPDGIVKIYMNDSYMTLVEVNPSADGVWEYVFDQSLEVGSYKFRVSSIVNGFEGPFSEVVDVGIDDGVLLEEITVLGLLQKLSNLLIEISLKLTLLYG